MTPTFRITPGFDILGLKKAVEKSKSDGEELDASEYVNTSELSVYAYVRLANVLVPAWAYILLGMHFEQDHTKASGLRKYWWVALEWPDDYVEEAKEFTAFPEQHSAQLILYKLLLKLLKKTDSVGTAYKKGIAKLRSNWIKS